MGFGKAEYPMKHISSVLATSGYNLESYNQYSYSRDEVELARYGKKQQLRVGVLLEQNLLRAPQSCD